MPEEFRNCKSLEDLQKMINRSVQWCIMNHNTYDTARIYWFGTECELYVSSGEVTVTARSGLRYIQILRPVEDPWFKLD